MENRVAVVDISWPETVRLIHRTGPLPEKVTDIVVAGGRAWIAAGGAGLFPMNLDTDQPEPDAPIAMPGSVHRLAADPPLVAAATSAGVVLLSAADPTLHVVLGAGHVTDVALARFTAFVMQGDQILVFDITKPALPSPGRTIRLEGEGLAVAADRTQLMAADAASALRVYSLENPRNPRRRGSLGPTHVVRKILPVADYAYLATESGLRVVQIAPEPFERNLGGPPGQVVHGLAADATHLIVTGSRGLEVFQLREQWGFGWLAMSGLPSMGDAIDLSWRGSHLFAAGGGGLTIADVAQPEDPRVLARVDLRYPEPIAQMHPYVLLGDGTLLHVVEAADPARPRVVAAVSVANPTAGNEYITDIEVTGTTAYLANGRYGGLTVVDVTTPTRPVPQMVITSTGWASKLSLTGPGGGSPTLALVGDSQEGLIAYDIRDRATPAKVASTGGTWYPFGLGMWGDYVVVVAGDDGLFIFDVQNDPGRPEFGRLRRVASWWPGVSARAIAIKDGIAYVGGHPEGSGCRIVAVSLANPADPREVGCWAAPGDVDAVAVAGDLLAVSAFEQGVRLVEVSVAEVPVTATATGAATVVATASTTATGAPPGDSTPTATVPATAPPAPFSVYMPAVATHR
jgi:hypothetical protein